MDIITTRRTKVEEGYELLADITVGTATTSVDITGLNIGKGDEVVLVSDVANVTTFCGYGLFVNNNTTSTNYWSQHLAGVGTSVVAERTNNPRYLYNNSAVLRSVSIAKIKLTNSGYFIFQSSSSRDYSNGTRILVGDWYGTSTFTMSAITSLKTICEVTNNISSGSRFQIYRIAGGA